MSSVKLIQFISSLLLKAKQAQGNPFVKCIYFYICQMGFLEPDLILHLTNVFIFTVFKCIYFYSCQIGLSEPDLILHLSNVFISTFACLMYFLEPTLPINNDILECIKSVNLWIPNQQHQTEKEEKRKYIKILR